MYNADLGTEIYELGWEIERERYNKNKNQIPVFRISIQYFMIFNPTHPQCSTNLSF